MCQPQRSWWTICSLKLLSATRRLWLCHLYCWSAAAQLQVSFDLAVFMQAARCSWDRKQPDTATQTFARFTTMVSFYRMVERLSLGGTLKIIWFQHPGTSSGSWVGYLPLQIFWELPCCPFSPALFKMACVPCAAAVTCRSFSGRTCNDSKVVTLPGNLGTPKLKAKFSWFTESWIFTCGFQSTAGSSTYGKFYSLGLFIPHSFHPLHLLFKFFLFILGLLKL